MERTLRVTGKGNLSVTPDTVRIIITQSDVENTYEGAIKESADKKNVLNTALIKLGFEKEDLKTLYFNVDSETESYQTKDKSWRRRLLGYRYTHRMKLDFPKASNMLGKVLVVVATCTGEPEFTIQYTISDPETAKNELLAKAVEDSMKKAKILSGAAGVEIGDIQNIDYSWGQIEFVTRPVNDLCLKECCEEDIQCLDEIDLDIEADDIDVSDTVTVVWSIK